MDPLFIFVNSTLSVVLNKQSGWCKHTRHTLSSGRQTEPLLIFHISLTNDESVLTVSSRFESSPVILLYYWRWRQRYWRHCLLVQSDGLVSQLPRYVKERGRVVSARHVRALLSGLSGASPWATALLSHSYHISVWRYRTNLNLKSLQVSRK
jgi:hypothetical protein